MSSFHLTSEDSLNEKPHISIVVPAYNEEENVGALYAEIRKILPSLLGPVEIIFVDDGSSDLTWERILSLHRMDQNVKALRLSRNFGHQYALLAGLARAAGDAVISMDADLQHPPEVIPIMVSEWQKGNKIVNTVRKDPEDFSLAKRVATRVFYRGFSYLCGVTLQNGMADFRLLDRQVLQALLQCPEEGLFLRGLTQWAGFTRSNIEYQAKKRFRGTAKYNVRSLIKLAWGGITSFSIVPLRLAIIIGLATSMLAFLELAYVLYIKLFRETVVIGWASTVGIISLLFGILFLLLGIVGEYIGRILIEVRGRPRFLVSEELGVMPDLREGMRERISEVETSPLQKPPRQA